MFKIKRPVLKKNSQTICVFFFCNACSKVLFSICDNKCLYSLNFCNFSKFLNYFVQFLKFVNITFIEFLWFFILLSIYMSLCVYTHQISMLMSSSMHRQARHLCECESMCHFFLQVEKIIYLNQISLADISKTFILTFIGEFYLKIKFPSI